MFSRALIASAAAAGLALAKPIAHDDGPAPNCPHTVFHAPQFTWGPVATVWTETKTVTTEVNCSGCDDLVVTTIPFGPGPVVFFTTTVTASTASTTTVPVCSVEGTMTAFGNKRTVPTPTTAPDCGEDGTMTAFGKRTACDEGTMTIFNKHAAVTGQPQ